MSIEFRSQGPVSVVTINRPEVANAIDRPTAAALADVFRRFEADESLHVAVLTGANGTFCAGEQWSLSLSEAIANEYDHGMRTLSTGEMLRGLDRYGSGRWRSGDFS